MSATDCSRQKDRCSLSILEDNRMQNTTDDSEMSSGMFYDSENETDNGTEFNCLSENISSSRVTNESFWKINQTEGAPVVATVFVIYFLVASGWNLFIIFTFLCKRKMLREPANILLLNLAIADLMVAMTQMFFSAITEASLRFVFGPSDVARCGMCNFVGVFFMLLYGVSMHTLAALSFDRFLLLYKPFRYKKLMSPRNTIILVVIIWLISCLLAVPPIGGLGQIEFNIRFGSCVPRFSGINIRSNIANFAYVAYVALESLFPIITIAVCSFWTYWFVNKFLKRNYRRRSFYNRRGSEGRVQQRHEDSRYHHQQQQLVKVFGALLISTAVSWTPVLIVVIIVGILGSADDVPDEVYVVGWICYLTAPVFHPIIESFFVKDMRLVVCKGITRVNRAGSFIARSTTGMFGNKDIEMAMEKADDPDYISDRKIKFLGNNKRKRTVSMTTEVTEVPPPNSRDNTPSPRVAQKVVEANQETANVQLRDKPTIPNSSTKPARRITFSDESPPLSTSPLHLSNSIGDNGGETPLSETAMTQNGVRKSALKSPRDRPFLSPVGELDMEEDSCSSSGDGSVFNTPVSPQQNHQTFLTHSENITKDDGGRSGSSRERGGGGEGTKEPNVIELGFRNGAAVPTGEDIGDVSLNSNEEDAASDLKLLDTVYSRRRGSSTLV